MERRLTMQGQPETPIDFFRACCIDSYCLPCCSLAQEVGCAIASYSVSRWLTNGEHIALSELESMADGVSLASLESIIAETSLRRDDQWLTYQQQVVSAFGGATSRLRLAMGERAADLIRLLEIEEQTRCQAFQATLMGEVRAPVGDLAARMLKAKEASGKTFDELADELGWTNAYTCQLILGQAQLKPASRAKFHAARGPASETSFDCRSDGVLVGTPSTRRGPRKRLRSRRPSPRRRPPTSTRWR